MEDSTLSLDNEHLTVVGKGGKRRAVLLDDPRLVQPDTWEAEGRSECLALALHEIYRARRRSDGCARRRVLAMKENRWQMMMKIGVPWYDGYDEKKGGRER